MLRAWVLPVLLAILAAPAAAANMSAAPPPPGVLLQDGPGFDALQRRHAAILRRAGRSCAHQYGWQSGVNYRACVVGSVENAIMISQDPQLQAYHRSLPFPIRYQFRPDAAPAPWQIK
jgi:hypothetical protein